MLNPAMNLRVYCSDSDFIFIDRSGNISFLNLREFIRVKHLPRKKREVASAIKST